MSGERKNAIVHQVLQPPGWPAPRGYVNGVSASGRLVFTGGLVGWDTAGVFADGMAAQVGRALENTLAVLAEADAGPEHIVRMTWYVKGVEAYAAALPGIGEAWRALMGRAFPPMAVVEVVRLVEPEALVEIETTAVVPA